jgi:hypothetical protein
MMQILEVGQQYSTSRTTWPEGAEDNYTRGGHELRLFFKSPRPGEVEAVRKEPCEFAVSVEGTSIILQYRFGDHPRRRIPWSDAVFSIHLVPARHRCVPAADANPEARAALQVLLIDADTGILKAMRYRTLSPEFTRTLESAIRAQALQPWPGQMAHRRALQTLFARSSTQDLLRRAVARTHGGA